VDPFTRQSGPWTITHAPARHSTYDRVLGRLATWSLEIGHATGWHIVEHEGETTADIYTPSGLLVAVIRPEDFADPRPPSLTAGRSPVLIDALTAWTHAHAEEFDEPDIHD